MERYVLSLLVGCSTLLIGGIIVAEEKQPFAMAKKVKSQKDGALIRRLMHSSKKEEESRPDDAQIFLKPKLEDAPTASAEKSKMPSAKFSRTIVDWSEKSFSEQGPVDPDKSSEEETVKSPEAD